QYPAATGREGQAGAVALRLRGPDRLEALRGGARTRGTTVGDGEDDMAAVAPSDCRQDPVAPGWPLAPGAERRSAATAQALALLHRARHALAAGLRFDR